MLTLGAGLFAAGVLLYTARTFALSRRGQVTDRYAKAIEQLGSDKLDVRIGAIYALERVALDFKRDHPAVMGVLAAFIREHSHDPGPAAGPGGARLDGSVRPDVQTALAVIGRRLVPRDIASQPIDLSGADLAGADLSGAILGGVHFAGTDLSGAKLTGADLSGADLNRANLTGADLTDVSFIGVDLTGARWPMDTPVPAGWKPDTRTGRLEAAGTAPGRAEAG